MRAQLDQILNDAVDAGEIANVGAIVTDRTDVLYEGVTGPWRSDSERPLALDAIYEIHSMTKPIAAAGVMQLVEQGRLDLDADCGELIPTLKNPLVLEGFDRGGDPMLRQARTPITLRRLLTHTAGFVYDQWNPLMRTWFERRPLSRAELYAKPENCPPLAFDPGTRWEYGINIDWAGKVLEAVAGEPLAEYLKRELLDPLGMASTGYVADPAQRARLAGVHQRGPDGRIAPVDFERPDLPASAYTGGGGMFGAARDYARFMRMILNEGALDGVRVLKPETVRMMSRNQMGDIEVTPLPAANPELTFPVDLFPGHPKGWGLSFMINKTDIPGARPAGSLAWAGLRNTYFWIDPKTGVGGALFTQMLPFADPRTLAVLDRFERMVYAALT